MHKLRRHSAKVCLALIALAALPVTQAVAIEEPEYTVIERYPDFELRQYAPYLVAETEVSGTFDEVGNKAFRILADYIFGGNAEGTKMKMTAPVGQQPVGAALPEQINERISPASETGLYRVSFVMPSRFTMTSLPAPNDARIEIREEPSRQMAAIRYSGRWTESNYRERERELLAAIRSAGLTPLGAPTYARYNSPFSLPIVRRNEVIVEVRATP